MSSPRFFSEKISIHNCSGYYAVLLAPACLMMAWLAFKKNSNKITLGCLVMSMYAFQDVFHRISHHGQKEDIPCEPLFANWTCLRLSIQIAGFTRFAMQDFFSREAVRKYEYIAFLCALAGVAAFAEKVSQDIEYASYCNFRQ